MLQPRERWKDARSPLLSTHDPTLTLTLKNHIRPRAGVAQQRRPSAETQKCVEKFFGGGLTGFLSPPGALFLKYARALVLAHASMNKLTSVRELRTLYTES